MAIMKPKATTAAAALPSVAEYQKKLSESVSAYKPQIESYLQSKSQYDAQKKAYDTNYANWQSALNTAQSNYDKAVNVANQMGYNPALNSYWNTLQNVKNSRPSPPAAFTQTQPTAPAGTKFANNALSYFNPTEYGVTGLQSELEKVRKNEASGSKIMKKPVYTFDITQLEQNLLDKTALDLTKLGDFGGVLAQMAGAGSSGQVYVPKSALTKLAQAYKDYGLGDITQAVTDKAAWDVASPSLSKYVKIPEGYTSVTAQQLADKKAYEEALSKYNAQKADWTAKTYDPYQTNLSKYQSQFTGQYAPSSTYFHSMKVVPDIDLGGGLKAVWGSTSSNYQSPGSWYVNRGDKGWEKLNPATVGPWTKGFKSSGKSTGMVGWSQMYNPATFYSDPGAAPVFSGVAPTAPSAYTGEHKFADLAPSQGGSSGSALSQLLRSTHGARLGGVQGSAAQQALTQQLYGTGGLSQAGRLLSEGTNKSLSGISNPKLRAMLSQQLFD